MVMRWARLPNTIVKVSSLTAIEADPKLKLEPILRALTDAWGADRMIYGDGFGPTTTGASYAQAFERFMRAELLSALGRDDQARGWRLSIAERSPYEVIYPRSQ